jgi:hypothetical protein
VKSVFRELFRKKRAKRVFRKYFIAGIFSGASLSTEQRQRINRKGEKVMKVSAVTSLSIDERELQMQLLLALTTLVLDLVLMQANAIASSPQLKANARVTMI